MAIRLQQAHSRPRSCAGCVLCCVAAPREWRIRKGGLQVGHNVRIGIVLCGCLQDSFGCGVVTTSQLLLLTGCC